MLQLYSLLNLFLASSTHPRPHDSSNSGPDHYSWAQGILQTACLPFLYVIARLVLLFVVFVGKLFFLPEPRKTKVVKSYAPRGSSEFELFDTLLCGELDFLLGLSELGVICQSLPVKTYFEILIYFSNDDLTNIFFLFSRVQFPSFYPFSLRCVRSCSAREERTPTWNPVEK